MKNERPVYGKTLREYSHAGITLTERSYPAGLHIPLHTHDQHVHFNLVLRGGYFETARNQTDICADSMMVFHPEGAAHANDFFNQETLLFNVRVDVSRLDPSFQDQPASYQTRYLGPGLLTELATLLHQELQSIDEVSALVIEELVTRMLAAVNRPAALLSSSKAPSWLSRVREILHSDFQQPLTLEDIARQVGVHKVHLGRVFHQHFHCTVGEYLRFLRVERACSELSMTDTRLGEISQECGFSDQPHFSRIFKRLTAFTPLEYRNIFGGH
jgi:AraC-like DNA-binding protein